jgi:hypothetical protein
MINKNQLLLFKRLNKTHYHIGTFLLLAHFLAHLRGFRICCQSLSPIPIQIKGTVQRKLTGVLSGINRMLMICSSVAWYFYLNLKSLGFLNLN